MHGAKHDERNLGYFAMLVIKVANSNGYDEYEMIAKLKQNKTNKTKTKTKKEKTKTKQNKKTKKKKI